MTASNSYQILYKGKQNLIELTEDIVAISKVIPNGSKSPALFKIDLIDDQ